MPKIAVVGSINMDVVTPMKRMPTPGETIHVEDISLIPGGKGANAAVAAARLGGEVSFVGCVGNDAFGRQLIQSLKDQGIDTQNVTMVNGPSGTAVILLDQTNGQNAIMVSPGANDQVRAPVNDEWYAPSDVLMLQLETPAATALNAARLARANAISVILDPAPASADLPTGLLKMVDILVPNESELAILTRRPIDSLENMTAAARLLINSSGVGEVVVTMGERGVLRVTRNAEEHFRAMKVNVRDTTAAGDTFAGALAVSLASGVAMPEAIPFAVTAAALTCTRMGAQTSLPTRQEVQDYLEAESKITPTRVKP